MILEDISDGEGVCLVDPRGDLAESVIGRIPEERAQDVIYLNPTRDDNSVGLNILRVQKREGKVVHSSGNHQQFAACCHEACKGSSARKKGFLPLC